MYRQRSLPRGLGVLLGWCLLGGPGLPLGTAEVLWEGCSVKPHSSHLVPSGWDPWGGGSSFPTQWLDRTPKLQGALHTHFTRSRESRGRAGLRARTLKGLWRRSQHLTQRKPCCTQHPPSPVCLLGPICSANSVSGGSETTGRGQAPLSSYRLAGSSHCLVALHSAHICRGCQGQTSPWASQWSCAVWTRTPPVSLRGRGLRRLLPEPMRC